MTPESIADAICTRINCRGIGRWLGALAEHRRLDDAALMPRPPLAIHLFDAAPSIRLTLSHPHAGHVAVGDVDRWLIIEARFEAAKLATLPFGLDADRDTPASATANLGVVGSALRTTPKGEKLAALIADPRYPPLPLLDHQADFVARHSTIDFGTANGTVVALHGSNSVQHLSTALHWPQVR